MECYKGKSISYLRQSFTDFEQFRIAAQKWSLDFKQLDDGKFYGEITLIDMSQLQIGAAQFNRHFEQKGITPIGYRTFAIPADQKQSFIWHGYQITGNKVLIFPKSGELDAISYPGFSIYTISMATELINKLKRSHFKDDLQLLDDESVVIELSAHQINLIRQQLLYLLSEAKINPESVDKMAYQKIFTTEIPLAILSHLFKNKETLKRPVQRVRDISLRKAIDYLKECEIDLPTVKELCLISGASLRTLEYAFKEKYGFGPKGYIKKLLLNHVQKELTHAKPSTKVKDVAHRYGFSHLGQFAADYKKLFRELPSETLKS